MALPGLVVAAAVGAMAIRSFESVLEGLLK